MDNGKKEEVFPRGQKFKFSCHEGLECFNNCCRNINIFLSPYDVLRMKNKLGLTSGEFLSKFTTKINKGEMDFVLLKMNDDEEKKCPFVTSNGCKVYHVRPWSCRIAPIDLREDGYCFIFDSALCHGQNEGTEWTLDEWMENQGLKIYEEKERLFKEIPFYIQITGMKNVDKHIQKIIYMACYDLDNFRRFVFESSFLYVFNTGKEEIEKIRYDDEELLQFSFYWLCNQFDVGETMDLWEEVFGD